MGYLDYGGLQYLWGKLKEKFASKSHTHDDRYYTESEMNGKLNSKVDNTEAGANGLLSKLNTNWTAAPTDDTYFIRQDTGGTNTFGRLKFSTLWAYIKSKTDSLYQKKSTDLSDVISFTKSIKLTTDWQDTGISGTNLASGTYIVQVSGFNSSYTQLYQEIYSGVMSWFASPTNSSNASEIFLHNAGHADNSNAIYLRTVRTPGAGSNVLKLQIACKVAATGTDSLVFKFRRLI